MKPSLLGQASAKANGLETIGEQLDEFRLAIEDAERALQVVLARHISRQPCRQSYPSSPAWHRVADFWVIFDTTVLRGADHRLDSAKLRQVLSAKQSGGYRIAIPESVIREAIRQDGVDVEAQWTKLVKDAERVARRLGLNVGDLLDLTNKPDSKARAKDYERRLREAADEVIPLPEVRTEEAFDRAMNRVKPFDDESKGFQDFVLWKSIVAFLTDPNRRSYFITDNIGDFCAQGGELHPDLVKDMERAGRHRKALTVVRSPAALLEGPLQASFDFLDEYKGKKLAEAFGDGAAKSARIVIGGMLSDLESFDDLFDANVTSSWGDEILGIVRIGIGNIVSAMVLPDNEMLVGVTFTLEAVADEPTELTRKGQLYTRHLNEYHGVARLIIDMAAKETLYANVESLAFVDSYDPSVEDVIALERPDDADEPEEPEPGEPDPDE